MGDEAAAGSAAGVTSMHAWSRRAWACVARSPVAVQQTDEAVSAAAPAHTMDQEAGGEGAAAGPTTPEVAPQVRVN